MSASRAERLILQGFSQPADVAAAIGTMDQDLEVERGWYADTPGFGTLRDIVAAYRAGELQYIRPDPNMRPNTRFMNPQLNYRHVPLLTPNAATVLHVFGAEWRKAAQTLGVNTDIRLAVTSMTRTAIYQQELVDAGKYASDTHSTHVVGNAFDIDLGG